MGTVATYCDRARVRVRDSARIELIDPEVLGILNGILETIYQTLVNVNSNLVYALGTVTTVDGTAEYTPTFTFDSFLRDGSWVDGEDTYLKEVSEADKIKWDYTSTTNTPEAYYITEDGKVGYLWVPDDAYTIYHTYWAQVTAITNYTTGTLPWGGIFNRYIERQLVIEILEMQEKDTSMSMFHAQTEWDKAMTMVYNRGIRRERQASDMFSIGNI